MSENPYIPPYIQGQYVVVQWRGAFWWYDYETLQTRIDMAVKYPILSDDQEGDIAVLADAMAYLREHLTIEAVLT